MKLAINIVKLKLKNQVIVASGTFGYAEEFADFIDLRKLGAIVTKTITLKPRQGNPPPRTCETPAGMLNSIGLENPGAQVFIEKKLPLLAKIVVPKVVSISSENDPEEFVVLARIFDKVNSVAALELNISCPNIRANSSGFMANSKRVQAKLISQDQKTTYDLVKSVRKATLKPLITKLSPNVTDITEIALATEAAGSDAVSLVNTFSGMSIDIKKRMPKISTITAGLSGPAIRPIALRMVWEVYQKVKIPIIGMGGIMDSSSALEFILAGATAVGVGTANFINPKVAAEIIGGIESYLKGNRISSIKHLTGSLKCQI